MESSQKMNFRDFLLSLGINPPQTFTPGQWQRCSTTTHPRKKNASIKLVETGDIGFAQDFANMAEPCIWRQEGATNVKPLDQAEIRSRIAAKKRELIECTKAAREFYAHKCTPLLHGHPYLDKKGLDMSGCYGLKQDERGNLVVPMSLNGSLISLQRITPEGTKLFWSGATTNGTSYVIKRKKATITLVCEGLATGLTVKVLKPAITDYTNPTTYVIESTNGSTSFRLVDSNGNAIETIGGTPTGITYTILAPSIVGWSNPTTYYISETNGATYFTLVDANGDAIETTGGLVTSAVPVRVQPPSITGYSNPTTYYIVSTNANNQFTLSASAGGAPITTAAGTLDGLTFVYSPFAIGQQILVENIVPTGFRGTKTVTDVSQSSVSFAGSTAGPQTTPGSVSDPHPVMIMYSNTVPGEISDIEYVDATTQKITLVTPYKTAPYAAGEQIVISGVSNIFNITNLTRHSIAIHDHDRMWIAY